MTLTDDYVLTKTQKRQLTGPVMTSAFSDGDLLYRSFDDFSKVYEVSDLDLRAMREMLSFDGNPRKLEQTLTLPIRGANWEIRGSGRVAKAVRDLMGPCMSQLIATCTSAIAYRKAFHEVTWALDGNRVLIDQVLMRPAVSCEAAFRDYDGSPDGFRQRLTPISAFAAASRSVNMGWIDVPASRAFIYTHGTHREPLRGVSDLDVSLYCWDNIRKLQFLWCQYLEQQSLPKVLIYGDDDIQATQNATNVANAGSSATIPMRRPNDPQMRGFEILESSGRGAAQFKEALLYWEGKQTQSVLASFMDLAQRAVTEGAGSNALSADQSEFFLGSRQAVADEIAWQITHKLITPFVYYNWGTSVEVPYLHIGPIGNRQTDRALALLTSIIDAPTVNAPPEFTGFLINHTAAFLGLDAVEIADAVDRWSIQQQQEQVLQQAQAAAAAATADAGVTGSTGLQPNAQAPDATMSAALDVTSGLVQLATEGIDPHEVIKKARADWEKKRR